MTCSYFSSAGVGRTGTFIALDALYRQGIKEGKIHIVEYVNTMREDRMNMIQNAVSFPTGPNFFGFQYIKENMTLAIVLLLKIVLILDFLNNFYLMT